MLAHVVTVREINPFAKNGVMKVDDLLHLFKGQSRETRDYIMSLLSKFEVSKYVNKKCITVLRYCDFG